MSLPVEQRVVVKTPGCVRTLLNWEQQAGKPIQRGESRQVNQAADSDLRSDPSPPVPCDWLLKPRWCSQTQGGRFQTA